MADREDEPLYAVVDLTGPHYEPSERTYEAAIQELNAARDQIKIVDSLNDGWRKAHEVNRTTIDRQEAELTALRAQFAEQTTAFAAAREFISNLLGIDSEDEWVHRPPLPCPPQLEPVLQAVIREYWRARNKHGDNCIDGVHYTDHQRLAIVMEEVGEIAHELTYDVAGGVGVGLDDSSVEAVTRMWKEVIQAGTMLVGWGGYLWQQYGAALGPQSAAASAEVRPSATGAGGVVVGVPRPISGVPSRFARDVAELRTGAPVRVPARPADIVGRDLEGRYWALWNEEGLRCHLTSRSEVDAAMVGVGHASVVNLTRVDLAQYADAEHG